MGRVARTEPAQQQQLQIRVSTAKYPIFEKVSVVLA